MTIPLTIPWASHWNIFKTYPKYGNFIKNSKKNWNPMKSLQTSPEFPPNLSSALRLCQRRIQWSARRNFRQGLRDVQLQLPQGQRCLGAHEGAIGGGHQTSVGSLGFQGSLEKQSWSLVLQIPSQKVFESQKSAPSTVSEGVWSHRGLDHWDDFLKFREQTWLFGASGGVDSMKIWDFIILNHCRSRFIEGAHHV